MKATGVKPTTMTGPTAGKYAAKEGTAPAGQIPIYANTSAAASGKAPVVPVTSAARPR